MKNANASNKYYFEEYFEWQKDIGIFGGKANLFKFEEYIKDDTWLVDYGCGGGYLLQNIECARKIGVEVNPIAAQCAIEKGLEVFSDISDVPDRVDLVISNHALEHVDSPLWELRKVKQVLKSGGMCVFVTPYENLDQPWNPDDVNKHLYTWSPLNLGNLFERAGFEVLECCVLHHTWPPDYLDYVRKRGWSAFHRRCVKYSRKKNIKQVKIVARLP